MMQLTGIHHLTAVTANAAGNHAFYTGTLAGEVSAALSAQPARIVSLGVPRQFLTNSGKLADHEQACGLDAAGLRERISTVLQ